MPLLLYVETHPDHASVQQLLVDMPQAAIQPPPAATRSVDMETVVQIAEQISVVAEAVKDVSEAGVSLVALAAALVGWKRRNAPEEKTVLIDEQPEGTKRMTLDADTTEAEVAEFLKN